MYFPICWSYISFCNQSIKFLIQIVKLHVKRVYSGREYVDGGNEIDIYGFTKNIVSVKVKDHLSTYLTSLDIFKVSQLCAVNFLCEKMEKVDGKVFHRSSSFQPCSSLARGSVRVFPLTVTGIPLLPQSSLPSFPPSGNHLYLAAAPLRVSLHALDLLHSLSTGRSRVR